MDKRIFQSRIYTKFGYNTYYYSNGFLIPSSEIKSAKLHNTGNVNLSIKVPRNNFYTGQSWEDTNVWEEILPNEYSKAFTHYDYNSTMSYFILNTFGIVFDNKGINQLTYRHGTSIIGQQTNMGLSEIVILDIR